MSSGNSAYSPLPQSNSDSDGSSEEELHVSQGNRIINRASKVHNVKIEKAHNEQKSNIINYKPLDNDGDVGVTLNKFQLSPDEVSILKPEGGLEIFSTSRKICFVFSLLLCVFTTVAFIWILPCNVGSCPNASITKNDFTWEKNLPNIEIFGPICLVPDQKGNQNLVFLTRNHLDSEQNLSESSLTCLRGKDGSYNWKIIFSEEPVDVDCKLIDVNSDRFDDCIVYGRNFLRAVNSLSGKEFWDIQEANKREHKLYFSNFPTLIPDLDNDEVKELLLPCSFVTDDKETTEISFENYLVIISGKTGVIINRPMQIKLCSAIHNLMIENNSILSFTCFNSTKKELFQTMSLAKVYRTLKNPRLEKLSESKAENLNQHKGDSDMVYVKGFRLTLKNQGHCPEDCEVHFDIKDERGSPNNITIYSYSQKNAYGMTPIAMKTRTETGFILKLWSWYSKAEKSKFQNDDDFSVPKMVFINNDRKNITKRSEKLNYLLNNSKILDNEMFLGSEWKLQRKKRTATGLLKKTSGKSVLNSGNLNLHMIGETIVKISLNDSYLCASNVTKDEIIQICKSQICEPNVFQQRHSVLVAQFGPNGKDKLITYASKYIHKKEEIKNKSKAWQIQAKIRVLNL